MEETKKTDYEKSGVATKNVFSRRVTLTTASLIVMIVSIIIISVLTTAYFSYRESSQDLFADSDAQNEPNTASSLPRNERIELKTDLSKALHNSIISGGDFLVRMQNPDGSYKYEYFPETDTYSSDNNILRHAGVVYSLAMLYQYNHEQKYLDSAKKGADFLLQHVEHIDDDTAYIFHDDDAKLGGAGLAVVALAELETIERTGKYLDDIKDLTNFILFMQEDTGKYKSYYIYNGEDDYDEDSYIYPGEAMLALVRAYSLLEDQRYLASVEKAYDHYSIAFAQDPTTEFTPWTAQAFARLYEISPKQKYADFVFQMEDWLIGQQYLNNAPRPEYLGAYGTMSIPSITAGVRTEGVSDAYLLAKQLGYEEKEQRYKKSILLAMNFLMQLQHKKESVTMYQDPEEAVGAFVYKVGDTATRVDHTQHGISAMIKTLMYVPPEEVTIEPYLTEP
jgi:prenyltransferase beta subunit